MGIQSSLLTDLHLSLRLLDLSVEAFDEYMSNVLLGGQHMIFPELQKWVAKLRSSCTMKAQQSSSCHNLKAMVLLSFLPLDSMVIPLLLVSCHIFCTSFWALAISALVLQGPDFY